MTKRVERSYLDKWIAENGPYGVQKLASRTCLSTETIAAVRRGRIPKLCTMAKIAKAIGVSEEKLFPVSQDGGEQAS